MRPVGVSNVHGRRMVDTSEFDWRSVARAVQRILFGLTLVLCAGNACGILDVDIEDCALECESVCPSGSRCVHGYCVRNDSRATCIDDRADAAQRDEASTSSGGG